MKEEATKGAGGKLDVAVPSVGRLEEGSRLIIVLEL